MSENRQMSVFGIVLVAVSSVLVVDTIAASSIIGPSAILWWAVMYVFFFLPYGLVTAELGTTYPDEGGICDWVDRAFGRRVAARVAWFYWINYALWVPAVFFLFALVIGEILGLDLSPWAVAIIAIAMSWVKVWLTMFDLDQFMWIPNLGSVLKAAIMVLLGISGIVVGFSSGFANDINWSTIVPSLDAGMSYLPIILFNFMGFEVIAGASSMFRDPNRDIPRAVVLGGLLIMTFYILATIGILATIPSNEISESTGVLEAFSRMYGDSTLAFIVIAIIGLAFMYTLVSNVATWAMGVNRVVVYAAEQKLLPSTLATLHPKTGAPRNVALWNGVVATIVMIIYGFLASSGGGASEECLADTRHILADCLEDQSSVEDLFWDVFSLGAVTLLGSYVLLFPAFLKLRLNDKDRPKAYVVPGGTAFAYYCGIVPTVLLILAIIFFFYVPGTEFDPDYFRNVGAGLLVTVIIGEIIVRRTERQNR